MDDASTTKPATKEEVFALVETLVKNNNRVFFGELHKNMAIPNMLPGIAAMLKANDVSTVYIELDPYSTNARAGGTVGMFEDISEDARPSSCTGKYLQANHLPESRVVTGFDTHISLSAQLGFRVVGHDDIPDILRTPKFTETQTTGRALDRRDDFAAALITATDDGKKSIVIGGVGHGKNVAEAGRPSQQGLGERLHMPSIFFDATNEPSALRDVKGLGVPLSASYAEQHCRFSIQTDNEWADYVITTNDATCLAQPVDKDIAAQMPGNQAKAEKAARSIGACGFQAAIQKESMFTAEDTTEALPRISTQRAASAARK